MSSLISGVDRRAVCLCVIGTRPEVIKMAPVVRSLKASTWAVPYIVTTGQHTDLLAPAMAAFSMTADVKIELPRVASLNSMGSQVLARLDDVIGEVKPDFVIAQGDTTSVAVAALAAFYRKVPFVHVEAGLRTGDFDSPFPEEFNRRVVSLATTLHCAPTLMAARNLYHEGVDPDDCIVTGNTVIDALLQTAATKPRPPAEFPSCARPILVTAHRRENHGFGFDEAFGALRQIADRYPDVALCFPMHPNPCTREAAKRWLGGHPRIILSEPFGYREMVAAIQRSWLILTDSGGLQEEAPALGKPVLVMRDTTERPEALKCGAIQLVGTKAEAIVRAVDALYRDESRYEAMAVPRFPYGNGHAADQITSAIFNLWTVGQAAPRSLQRA
jgi:UDP-N-acetylglucosamine 2-epimerase (non-hydrolysing)